MSNSLRGVMRYAGDIVALVALIGIAAGLFAPYLTGQRVLIGNSDRINHYLPRLLTEVEQARAGETGYWDEHMLGGYNAHAWLVRVPGPVIRAFASAPPSSFLWIAAVATFLFMLAAGVGAYAFARDLGFEPFGSWVAALLYQYASASTLRIVQNDWTFAVLVHIPFLYLALRRLARNPGLGWYALSAALAASLLYFTFVQEAVYAGLLFGSYCLYRGWKTRSWALTFVLLSPLAIGSVAAWPRLWAVVSEQRLLERPNDRTPPWNFDALYEFQNIRPYEIFRWLDDGFFGRYPSEVTTLANNLNLSEGFQLYTSTFACLFLVAGLVALMWRRAMKRNGDRPDETDFAFHLAVLSFTVAVVVLKPIRHLVYLGFLGTDFTHTRIVIVALLSQSVVVASLLSRSSPMRVDAPGWWRRKGVAGACIAGLAIVMMVERAALRLGDGRAFQLEALAVPALVMYRVLISGLILAAVAFGLWLRRSTSVPAAACFVGFLIVGQTVHHANFRLNGDHTRTGLPFQHNNHYMPSVGNFRSPAPEQVALLQRRVENDRYRTVFVADPQSFPVFAAPYLAPFWHLRALDGYLSGLPADLVALPWPDGVVSLRALSFPSADDLPWPLLAMCNVKYAIVIDEAFYTGKLRTGDRAGSSPAEAVTIARNPNEPVPREFFAAAVVPARDLTDAVRQLFPTRSSVPDVVQTSVVEGLEARAFSVEGAIMARHRQDTVDIRVSAANDARFLVLNERWHPGWVATVDDQLTPVYRVNATMRGIVVPRGATEIRLRFVPPGRDLEPVFLWAAAGMGGLGAVGLRRHQRSQ